jgi:hypothetical protein
MRGAVATRAETAGDVLLRYLDRAADDGSGVRATIAVAVAAALVSIIGWLPLGFPVRALTGIVPVGDCFGVPQGPLAYACSAKVALLTLAAPVALLAAVYLLRRRIADVIRRGIERMPHAARFLVGPSVASGLFVLTWANAHMDALQWGLVPQILFPMVVGLFGWVTIRWNVAIQERLSAFFARRDALTRRRRFAIAAAVPVVLSLVIGLDPAGFPWKEQLIVLVGLASAYLALVPRHGDLLEAVEEAVRR